MGRLAIVRCWWGETAELNYQLPIVNRQWSMGEAVRIGGDLECVVDGEAAVNGIRALRQKELQVRSLQAHHGGNGRCQLCRGSLLKFTLIEHQLLIAVPDHLDQLPA
jgi:hypothetical protein